MDPDPSPQPPAQPGAPAPQERADGFWASVKRQADRVSALQTLGAVALALAAGAAAGYQHFAKASEVAALQARWDSQHQALRQEMEAQRQALACDLRIEVTINAARGEAIHKVRAALKGLSTISRNDELLSEIRESVQGVDAALADIEKTRRLREVRKTDAGGSPCPV